MKIDEDDEFNRNDKKFVKMKMISSIQIYKLTKSVILVKSMIYKVTKISIIVVGVPAHFPFSKKNTKPTKHAKIHTKNKAITIFYFY